jgi:hypothetical protein
MVPWLQHQSPVKEINMNGFILYAGIKDNEVFSPDNFVDLGYAKDTCCLVKNDKIASLITWGTDSGDVHYSRNHESSLLVLNGYIAEAKVVQGIRSQQKASDALLDIFDRDHSLESFIKVAEQIHGSFSLVHMDLMNNKVYCITDRIASRPIWIKKIENAWIISSNANEIIYASRNYGYNLGALGSFLLYGGQVEPSKSIYKDVNALEQGSILVLDLVGKSSRHQWYRYQHTPNEKLSLDEWTEIASERLQNAAKRILYTSRQPLIFLSGGLDSRLTASAMRSVGSEPVLATLGDSENLEIKVAKSAAFNLDCRHEVIIRDPHWYLRSLHNNIFETTGGFLWTHGHFSNAYCELQHKLAVDSAMLGDFCEAFSKLCCTVDVKRKIAWTPSEFVAEFDSLHLPSYRPVHRESTLSLIKPKVRLDMEETLKQDIMNRYSRVIEVSTDPWIIADYFFRWGSAATIATFFMFLDVRSAGAERSLMFDKDVQELLETLPSSKRNCSNLGAKIIGKLWPKAAKTVNANSLLPLSWPNNLHSLSKFIRPGFGKMRRFFFDNSYKTTGSFPLRSLLYSRDPEWHNLFESIIINDSLFNEEVFDLRAIKHCWTSFCEGNYTLTNDLEKVIQIGLINLNINKRK